LPTFNFSLKPWPGLFFYSLSPMVVHTHFCLWLKVLPPFSFFFRCLRDRLFFPPGFHPFRRHCPSKFHLWRWTRPQMCPHFSSAALLAPYCLPPRRKARGEHGFPWDQVPGSNFIPVLGLLIPLQQSFPHFRGLLPDGWLVSHFYLPLLQIRFCFLFLLFRT